jgi:hypothetical protein
MTTEVDFRPGDRVRHSNAFMRAFSAQWHHPPGDFAYDYIAQSEGRIMLDLGNGSYMVEWQHHEDIDESERQMIWDRRDMAPA